MPSPRKHIRAAAGGWQLLPASCHEYWLTHQATTFWSRQGNTQRKLIQHGGLDALLFNKRHKSVLVRREVARALALFASKPDSHKELLRAEGIEGMVEMLYVT